jgi:hypothetical protein
VSEVGEVENICESKITVVEVAEWENQQRTALEYDNKIVSRNHLF